MKINYSLAIFFMAIFLVACDAPIAESASGMEDGSSANIVRLDFKHGCADWNNASVKVENFDEYWELSGFSTPGCKALAEFEHRYELDSRLSGIWNGNYLVEVGTADADREFYLISASSGERVAELWYVGEPEFGANEITYFEPTRDRADLTKCPQALEELRQLEQQGAVVMYSVKKKFSLENDSVEESGKKGCYLMF